MSLCGDNNASRSSCVPYVCMNVVHMYTVHMYTEAYEELHVCLCMLGK